MTVSSSRPIFRSRYLLAIISGILLALSFPKVSVAGLAWIAPGLMAAAALGIRGAERFRIGYVGGLAHYLCSLYWLLLIPYRWHGFPLGPAAGWLALSAFMATFTGLWVWLVGDPNNLLGGLRGATILPSGTNPRSSDSWLDRTLWALSGAAVWVALEMLIARIFTGFPWDLLGVSQYQILPLIQIASYTGVYGVGFLVIWGSLSLLSAGLRLARNPTARSAWVVELWLPLFVVGLVLFYGFHELREPEPSGRTIKVTFVQPSIPQTLIWDPSRDDERFQELIDDTRAALSKPCDLVLWPEAAVPKLLRWYPDVAESVTDLARTNHVWMIIGADDKEQRPNAKGPEDCDYFNASFLISPEGKITERYKKRALVIFGEYIPLVTWLPFIKWFTPIEGGFTPGDKAVPFKLPNLGVKTSVLICFEDVFPHLTREYPEPDTDFLVNLTNNGWFGQSAAQWQHAMTALFRAVENGLPLLRCSNNGLTCWVDAHGRIKQYFKDSQGTIYGKGFMTAEIPLLAEGEKRAPTFYTLHGDVFGWTCAAWGIMLLLAKIGSRLRKTS